MAFWFTFEGEYEKQFYDIMLFNKDFERDDQLNQNCKHKVIEHCWPNAGMFHTLDGSVIEGQDVYQFRKSRNRW